MRPPWRESAGWIPWLLLAVIVLSSVALFTEGVASTTVIVANKDLIDAVSKVVTTAFLLVGGLATYLRFFKGRLLRPKLNITLRHGIVVTEGSLLNWIEAVLENKGSVPIWNYQVELFATLHSEHQYSLEVHDFVSKPILGTTYESLIDVGETAYELAYLLVPPDVHAVTFQVVVTDQNKTKWDRSIMVANKASIGESTITKPSQQSGSLK